MSGDSSEPAGGMRDRGRGLRYRLFAELPRPPLAGLLAVTLWLGLVACGLAASPDAGLAGGDPVETAFQALLGATITGVTLVVTLNQLVLSQELGAVGDQRDRMAGAVAPDLADGSFGSFAVVAAALDFEYSWKLHRARRAAAHEDALMESQRAALDDLVETLTLFGPAREHVKTLYFQRELIALSRAVLAATLPFLVLLAYVLRIATVTRRTLSVGPFVLRDRGE